MQLWIVVLAVGSLVSIDAEYVWMKSRKNLDEVRKTSYENLKVRPVTPGKNDFVKTVHLVFMNHLDVGYASFVNNILNEYFQVYYPRAIAIATQLERGAYVEKFVYTTHPYLVTMYLDCPPNLIIAGVKLQCPNDTQRTAFVDAVKKGYINWHAGPMNLQIEMAEPWLFESGIDISLQLDERFNITRKYRALSQRDVPGMTIAAVKSMKRKGIIGVSVGVNNMTPPPAVPTLFNWQLGTDSVLGTWHPNGYPDNQGGDPAHPGGLSRHDCAVVDGFSHALCFAFRSDNTGPPESVREVLTSYEILRANFPNAQYVASSLEAYFEAALSIKDRLPTLSNEISDTWIQGVSSDPRKCAEYRTVSRVMRKCFASGACLPKDQRVRNATRFLIKIPEHTWGLYSERDIIHWSNPSFYPLRKTSQNFITIANTWIEQRQFTYLVSDALQDHPVVKDIQAELSQLTAQTPDLTNFEQISDTTTVFSCASGQIKTLQFGPDGSIVKLNFNNVDWADKEHALGSFVYDSFNETDFNDLARVYSYNGVAAGFYKKNLTASAHPESRTWEARIENLFKSKTTECDFYVKVYMVNHTSVTWYGAPNTIWIRYTVRKADPNLSGIDIDFQWFDKTITRLPEALSLAFRPVLPSNYKWSVSKMDQLIDPHSVLLNGSQYQHVIWDQGVQVTVPGLNYFMRVRSPDVPLAMVLTGNLKSHVFPAPLGPFSEPITGMAFNFYNNIWETNYIMWYPYIDGDENFRARFAIDFVSSGNY